MATKKQKREEALARREKFMGELAADGAKAQKWDRERREAKAAKIKAEAEAENRRQERILAAQMLTGASA